MINLIFVKYSNLNVFEQQIDYTGCFFYFRKLFLLIKSSYVIVMLQTICCFKEKISEIFLPISNFYYPSISLPPALKIKSHPFPNLKKSSFSSFKGISTPRKGSESLQILLFYLFKGRLR